MKGIVNLPKALRKMEVIPPLAQSNDIMKATATIPGRATIVVTEPKTARLVPIRNDKKNILSVICATKAYSEIKKDAPEISGRAVNIFV